MHPRIATIAAFSLAAHLTGAATRACVLEQGETRAVARVADSETLVLDDGRQVRLIGALGARHQDADADPEFWQPEADARAELERLVAGRTVQLGFAGRRVDRNGRVLAHVFVVDAGAHAEPAGPMPTGPQAGDAQPAAPSASDDPPGAWVQGHMIQTGHARAYVLPGNSACADALIALEGQARASGLGLWRNAAYAVQIGRAHV